MPATSINSLDACIPEKNATVSASAGSGKTWLLVTRIIRLLLAGAEPGNIVALTFTRKAAGEMQIRLNQRLYDLSVASDPQLTDMLVQMGCDDSGDIRQRARRLYETLLLHRYPVKLQTFHAFCQEILARFPLEADIPPGFNLTEDTSLLIIQARQMLFDQAALPGASAAQLSAALDVVMEACNGPENTRTALDNFLDQRSEWWAYTGHSSTPVLTATKTLNQQLELDQVFQPDDDIDAAIRRFLSKTCCEQLLRFQSLLLLSKGSKNLQAADAIKQALDRYQQLSTDDDEYVNLLNAIYQKIKCAFLTAKGTPLAQGRQLNKTLIKNLGDEQAQQFVDLHGQIAEQLLDCDEWLKRLYCRNINAAWYLAGNSYIEIFQQLKADLRVLDFNDLEWKTHQLLQTSDNAHWVQYKLDQRIDHLLIDEFQDTNPTQWHLLLPLLEEIASSWNNTVDSERLRSVFLVGDEKQSIYSFRRANPELQAEASHWLKQHMQATAVPLDFSRRSSPAIIDCVNRVFQQEGIIEQIHGFSRHDTHLATLPGYVELCDLFTLDEDEPDDQAAAIYFRNPLIQPRIIDTRTARNLEADHLAKQINALVTGDWHITGADGRSRRVQYRDIMILMRNRTHMNVYEQVLNTHNIPCIGSKKGGLLDSLEIQDLRCLLEVLVAPFNNLSLAQLLKSPVFDATDDDLEYLARLPGKKHWYQRLVNAAQAEQEDIHAALPARLARAARLLLQWQQYAEHLPVHDCLDRIYHEGNIIARYRSASTGADINSITANCQRFLELSLETDSGRYPGIARFLQRLQHIEKYSDSPPEEPLPGGESNRVRLMTVHASKGLEAPVVFIADSNTADSKNNAYKCLLDWPAGENRPVAFQLQLGSKYSNSISNTLIQKKSAEKAREELNLLYVAITRARQMLFISGSRGKKSSPPDSAYQMIAQGLQGCEQQSCLNNQTGRVITFGNMKNAVSPLKQQATAALPDNTADPRLSHAFSKEQLGIGKHWRMIAPSRAETDRFADLYAPASGDNSDFAQWRGTMIHRLLELLCISGAEPGSADSIEQPLSALASQTRLQHPAYQTDLDSCLQEALNNYNHAQLKEIFHPADEADCYNELPVMYRNHQGIVVKGVMDRVVRSSQSTVIVDYKSHRITDEQQLALLKPEFSEQLSYYRLGAQQLWPADNIKTAVLLTHSQQLIWL
jgi:ATP-dependent helicase/nuclease subunit A